MSSPSDPTGPVPTGAGQPGHAPAADTSPTPVYDPATGYDVPARDTPGAWATAAPVPGPAPASPASGSGAWFRQPWAIAVFVLAGVLALGASFAAGFATRSVIDRAVVSDRLVGDRGWDRGEGPGMGPGRGHDGLEDGSGQRGPQGGFGDRDGDGPLPQSTPTPVPTASG